MVEGVDDEGIELVYQFDADDWVDEFEEAEHLRACEGRVGQPNRDASYVLAKWARESRVPRNHLTKLLKALKKVDPKTLGKLPQDGRTLLKTAKTPVPTREVSVSVVH